MNKNIKMTSQEYFYCEMDKQVCNYSMYFPMLFNNRLDMDVFKESLQLVLESIPHLSCACEERFWRGKWRLKDTFEVNQIIENITIDYEGASDKDSFYSEAFLQFMKLGNKKIILEKEPPIKVKIISNDSCEYILVGFGIHHSIADGRGSMQLIKLVEEVYCNLLNATEVGTIKNYRSIPMKMLSENLIDIVKNTYKNSKTQMPKDLLDLVVPPDKINSNDTKIDDSYDSTEIIFLKSNHLKKLKSLYEDFGYSKNDIILHLILTLTYKLSEEANGKSPYIGVGVAVDSRKNLKEDILTITNYASMTTLLVKKEHLHNKLLVGQALQNFKKNAKGASFALEFILLNLFPLAIQKKVFQRSVKDMVAQMSMRAIQTTNVGEITNYVGSFLDSLELISFVGPAGLYGLPIISISEYKGDMTIYIRKANDRDEISLKIKQELEKILDSLGIYKTELDGDSIVSY